ncbi:MAG TPA: UDP-glucose 4-epimerase GalE [Salinivirgaceae bacterium]|nr:UDP-glucose 4-epimerase GalE [Salinivirgaceae bacterium]
MNKILITGGAGYIGSHTAAYLLERDYSIIILDNFSNSEPEVIDRLRQISGKQVTCVTIDLRDKNALLRFWEDNRDIDSVIHFAAYKAVGESVEKPLIYYENNIVGLINLLEIGLNFGLKNFVFSSSCTVYGQPEKLPVTEETAVVKAQSPYGNTKRINEEILQDVVNSGAALRVIALRYFNPIGAHLSGLIGELPRGVPNNLVPFITQTAAGVRKELKIFGKDYPTPDGTCIRDFIDVNDLAEAHLAALRYLSLKNEDRCFEAFNIGTGQGISVQQLVDTFIEATGVSIPYSYAPRRPGDVVKIWAETSLAEKILGWKAKTPLRTTLQNAWRWEKNYRKLL